MKKMLFLVLFLGGICSQVFAEIVTLNCPSISCGSCRAKISKELSSVEGIEKDSVAVDVEKKTVSFDYQKGKSVTKQDKEKFVEQLSKNLEKLGYPVVGDVVWGMPKTTK